MSVTCRRAEPAGYTLVELLMVVALLGLLAGLVVPRLGAWYASVQAAYQRDEVLRQLAGLGYLAYRDQREWVLNEWPLPSEAEAANAAAEAPPPLVLPAGWRLRAEPPLHYYRSGVCGGGVAILETPAETLRLRLAPPFCRPEPA
jgi:prepilin-type N-terminal cleavage/methylation domain-containing protein